MSKKTILQAILGVIMSAGLISGLLAQSDQESYYPLSYARVNYISGEAVIQRASDLGYEKAEINLVCIQGDKISTERGRLEINLGRRNFLRLDENTKLEIAALPREEEDITSFNLIEGRIYLKISTLPDSKKVEIHTPDASFYVLDVGLYRFEARPEGETLVRVESGEIEAAGETGSELVRRGENLTAFEGRFTSYPGYNRRSQDEFDLWNNEREKLTASRNTRRYLPAAIDEYEDELDTNGRWVYERPYGYVWVPFVNISISDWRPYLFGRWVWYPVIGWTWVSSEPWGWVVYHYGRWHWRVGLGWYWIPHYHWRPAWVYWWWEYNYVGWCPLSWYNRPVVIVNNYFYDRHYNPYVPIANRALTVIRKEHLQAPGVYRHVVRKEEIKGITQVSLKNAQPAIKPVPTSVQGKNAVQVQKLFESSSGGVVRKFGTTKPDGDNQTFRQKQSSLSQTGRIENQPQSPRLLPGQKITSLQPKETSSGLSQSENSKIRAIRAFPSRTSPLDSNRTPEITRKQPQLRISPEPRTVVPRESGETAKPRLLPEAIKTPRSPDQSDKQEQSGKESQSQSRPKIKKYQSSNFYRQGQTEGSQVRVYSPRNAVSSDQSSRQYSTYENKYVQPRQIYRNEPISSRNESTNVYTRESRISTTNRQNWSPLGQQKQPAVSSMPRITTSQPTSTHQYSAPRPSSFSRSIGPSSNQRNSAPTSQNRPAGTVKKKDN